MHLITISTEIIGIPQIVPRAQWIELTPNQGSVTIGKDSKSRDVSILLPTNYQAKYVICGPYDFAPPKTSVSISSEVQSVCFVPSYATGQGSVGSQMGYSFQFDFRDGVTYTVTR